MDAPAWRKRIEMLVWVVVVCVLGEEGGGSVPGAMLPSGVSFGWAPKLQAPGVCHRLPNPVKVAALQASHG